MAAVIGSAAVCAKAARGSERLRARGRRRAPPRRPRAAPGSARRSRAGAGARGPAARARGRAVARGSAASSRRSRSKRRRRPATRPAVPPAGRRSGRARRAGCRRGRREQRADQVASRSARAPCAVGRVVLVAADRDVLGAVVAGERAVAERQQRGSDREQAADQLLAVVAEPACGGSPCSGDRRPGHRGDHGAALERQLRLGQGALERAAGPRRPRRAGPGRAEAAA